VTTREVSILATEASRLLTAAGWDVEYADHALVLRNRRTLREVPYDDSLGSLVARSEVEVLILIGNRRGRP
jgi:hypothetical protein